uniref:Uncharacterized protein n=1 Tax=Nelumbo nucifera TaxID=4432 RepID=A0A822XX32_NELNU|nr:TPA_asm: hypothetical protein HUJ06_026354 [Nelumbo nucifera]
MVNHLQCRIIREEEKLSTRMASLQEDIADQPLANEYDLIGASNSHVDGTLDEHALALASMMEEADRMRPVVHA